MTVPAAGHTQGFVIVNPNGAIYATADLYRDAQGLTGLAGISYPPGSWPGPSGGIHCVRAPQLSAFRREPRPRPAGLGWRQQGLDLPRVGVQARRLGNKPGRPGDVYRHRRNDAQSRAV